MKKIIGGEPTDYLKYLIMHHGIIDEEKEQFKLPYNKYVIFLTDPGKTLTTTYYEKHMIENMVSNSLQLIDNNNNDCNLFDQYGILTDYGRIILNKLYLVNKNYSFKIYLPNEYITDIYIGLEKNENQYPNLFINKFIPNNNTNKIKKSIYLSDLINSDNRNIIYILALCRVTSNYNNSNYKKTHLLFRKMSFNTLLSRLNKSNNNYYKNLIKNKNYNNFNNINYNNIQKLFRVFNINKYINTNITNIIKNDNNFGYLFPYKFNIKIPNNININVLSSHIIFDTIRIINNKYFINIHYYIYRKYDGQYFIDNDIYSDENYKLNNYDVIITKNGSYIFYNNKIYIYNLNIKFNINLETILNNFYNEFTKIIKFQNNIL
jgi:hypothetical protein